MIQELINLDECTFFSLLKNYQMIDFYYQMQLKIVSIFPLQLKQLVNLLFDRFMHNPKQSTLITHIGQMC
jgi:hypothetical protein